MVNKNDVGLFVLGGAVGAAALLLVPQLMNRPPPEVEEVARSIQLTDGAANYAVAHRFLGKVLVSPGYTGYLYSFEAGDGDVSAVATITWTPSVDAAHVGLEFGSQTGAPLDVSYRGVYIGVLAGSLVATGLPL